VLVEDCETIWGKRKANNGFKLGTCSNPGLDAQIQELWPLVYQKLEITNHVSISLLFAIGILVEMKDIKIN
jgi:hypothetical protein